MVNRQLKIKKTNFLFCFHKSTLLFTSSHAPSSGCSQFDCSFAELHTVVKVKSYKFRGDESFTLPFISHSFRYLNRDISSCEPRTMFACVKMSIKMEEKLKLKNFICWRWFTIVLKVFSRLTKRIKKLFFSLHFGRWANIRAIYAMLISQVSGGLINIRKKKFPSANLSHSRRSWSRLNFLGLIFFAKFLY